MEQQDKQTAEREPSRRRPRRGKRGQGAKSARAVVKPDQAVKAPQNTAAQEAPAKPAQSAKPERAPKQRPQAPAPQKRTKPERPAAQKNRALEEDNSIQLISRRPPAQKYASFEEYMKAHGGGMAPFAETES